MFALQPHHATLHNAATTTPLVVLELELEFDDVAYYSCGVSASVLA